MLKVLKELQGYSQGYLISWYVVSVNKAAHVLALIYIFFPYSPLILSGDKRSVMAAPFFA